MQNGRNANLHLTVMKNIFVTLFTSIVIFMFVLVLSSFLPSLSSFIKQCEVVNLVIGQAPAHFRQGVLDETAPGRRLKS